MENTSTRIFFLRRSTHTDANRSTYDAGSSHGILWNNMRLEMLREMAHS